MIRMALIEVMSHIGQAVYKTTLGSGLRCLPSGDVILKKQPGVFLREQQLKNIIHGAFHAGEALVAWGELGHGPEPDKLEVVTAKYLAKIRDLK